MEASGINFKNYNPNNGELISSTGFALKTFSSMDDIQFFGGLINGVEIDWNSAELPNVSLDALNDTNTVVNTGQLMALINDMQGQINAIAAKLAELQ